MLHWNCRYRTCWQVCMCQHKHTHTHGQSSQEKRAHTYRERIHFPVNTHRLFKAPAAPRSCHMPTVCLALKQEANQRGNPLFCIIYSFFFLHFWRFYKNTSHCESVAYVHRLFVTLSERVTKAYLFFPFPLSLDIAWSRGEQSTPVRSVWSHQLTEMDGCKNGRTNERMRGRLSRVHNLKGG